MVDIPSLKFWDLDSNQFHQKRILQKIELYKAICQNKDHTRQSLLEELKFRNTTISNIIKDLIDKNLIFEGERKSLAGRGRPDYLILPNYNRFLTISAYIVDRRLFFSLININGNVLSERSVDVPDNIDNKGMIDVFKENISKLSSLVSSNCEIIGVSILLVGTVDRKNLIWVDIYRWPNIKYLSFKELEELFHIEINIRRILDAELTYLLKINPICSLTSTLIFYWGFGIGAAYSYKGNILESASGRFTNVGHTIINMHSDKVCRCGQTGCLETEAAIFGILPELNKIYPNLKEESLEIQKLINEPEVVALDVIDNAIKYISVCLMNLHKTLYPKRVYFIGPFFANRKIFDRIERYILGKLRENEETPELHLIDEGFGRCQWGGPYEMFENKILELIKQE